MPELPEVETVRRGLLPFLLGRSLQSVVLRRAGLRFPFPDDFAARLRGRRVEGLDRRGKYLLIGLDDGATWLCHLGMSGRLLLRPPAAALAEAEVETDGAAPRHEHVVILLDDGARLSFHDPRRFGFMDLIPPAGRATHAALRHLGPEPLDAGFDGATLRAALVRRRTTLKEALLDQRVVAGLGNIYACEALWLAGLSPLCAAATVTDAEAAALTAAVRTTLLVALTAGGSSLKDYRQVDGAAGWFQNQWRAYGRADLPCSAARCVGRIRRVVQSGRSSFYCLMHQRG